MKESVRKWTGGDEEKGKQVRDERKRDGENLDEWT